MHHIEAMQEIITSLCSPTDIGAPEILQLYSPFGSANASDVTVTLRYSPHMAHVMHRVMATNLTSKYVDVIPKQQGTDGKLVVTIVGLMPMVQYAIKVTHSVNLKSSVTKQSSQLCIRRLLSRLDLELHAQLVLWFFMTVVQLSRKNAQICFYQGHGAIMEKSTD